MASCVINSPNQNQIVFSWVRECHIKYIIYDVIKGVFTTNPILHSQSYVYSVSDLGVFCSYNKASNEVVFSWKSQEGFLRVFDPWYAIYGESTNYIRLLRAAKYVPLKPQKGP